MNKLIAVIVEDYPSPGRPSFVFVQQLVSAMVDKGTRIVVVAPQSITHSLLRNEPLRPRLSVEKTQLGNCYQVYRPYCLSFGGNNNILNRVATPFNSIGVSRVLNSIKPDILYGHFWHNAYKVRHYAEHNKIPIFVACGEGDNALEDLVKYMPDSQKRKFVPLVKGVISVSSENKRKCLQYGLVTEDRVIVLPNCVDKKLFYPQEDNLFKEQLGVKTDNFVISFTGAFIHRKGSKRVSQAVNLLNDPKIKLLFMGKPLKGDDCTPDCPGILYMGTTEHNKLPKLLNASDVFVLPTLKEGCCNAIVEALACGIPVISSNRHFNDDILNECNSVLVDPEDVSSIADAIRIMKDDKELYKQKKKYTISHSGDYSIETRADKILSFIKSRL